MKSKPADIREEWQQLAPDWPDGLPPVEVPPPGPLFFEQLQSRVLSQTQTRSRTHRMKGLRRLWSLAAALALLLTATVWFFWPRHPLPSWEHMSLAELETYFEEHVASFEDDLFHDWSWTDDHHPRLLEPGDELYLHEYLEEESSSMDEWMLQEYLNL